jgi:hypothetical protein
MITLPCLSDRIPEFTIEMTCRVQLAFERPDGFPGLPVDVKFCILHDHSPSAAQLCNDPATQRRGKRSTESAGLKAEYHAINAVPEPRWRRPIFENMAQMPATLAAVDFRANHPETAVRRGFDRAFEWGEKAGPAGSTLELALSLEERLAAADAPERARPMLIKKRARPGRLGRMATQHRVLLRCQYAPPLLICFLNWEMLGHFWIVNEMVGRAVTLRQAQGNPEHVEG